MATQIPIVQAVKFIFNQEGDIQIVEFETSRSASLNDEYKALAAVLRELQARGYRCRRQ